jgi:hypothetical protein
MRTSLDSSPLETLPPRLPTLVLFLYWLLGHMTRVDFMRRLGSLFFRLFLRFFVKHDPLAGFVF